MHGCGHNNRCTTELQIDLQLVIAIYPVGCIVHNARLIEMSNGGLVDLAQGSV